MKNNKAMSEIITTIIMIVLALIAVAVIWTLVNSLVNKNVGQATSIEKCREVALNVEGVSGCTATSCGVILRRSAGGETFTGIKFVFRNLTAASPVMSNLGNIAPLATTTLTVTSTGASFNAIQTTLIEGTVYFTDSSGKEALCSQPFTYNRIP
ncbi:MAG: archaellin/type IV pilin N-terminal domain-containing protein [archaeon]